MYYSVFLIDQRCSNGGQQAIPSTCENFIGIHVIVLEILAACRLRPPPPAPEDQDGLDRDTVPGGAYTYNDVNVVSCSAV